MSPPKPRRALSEAVAVHDQVYQALRLALITGKIAPGRGVSLRSLAAELGVSPMPVRDAVRRLLAERALTINPANKRLSVPSLTSERLAQLQKARLWIEPELAALAAAKASPDLIYALERIDDALGIGVQTGDVDQYMAANHAFHFKLYEAAGADVLLSIAGGLWLQIGPFMRVVFGRLGKAGLGADWHAEALAGLKAGNAEKVRNAMAADILQGMDGMREAVLSDEAKPPLPTPRRRNKKPAKA